MNNYFTSDLHFCHKNIIKYSNRPFRDVYHMNTELIANWNNIVQPDDNVYIVGDVSFGAPDETNTILNQLQGALYLVKGNHDKAIEKQHSKYFRWIKDIASIMIDDADVKGGKQSIVLCHYAMRVWERSHYGAWHLYGHSHGSLPDDPHSLSFDVGVDSHNYSPISYEQVKRIMSKKTFKPVDHHK